MALTRLLIESPLMPSVSSRPQDAEGIDAHQRPRRWIRPVWPAVLVAVPLTGLAFIADERRSVYLRALTNDANPFATAADAGRGIDGYFDSGTFRPVGRFWEMLVHGFVFEAGEATGVAPHIVLGIVRLAMVALLALGATALVAALVRSAGLHRRRSLTAMYPLALGAVLVANGASGALAQFPHTLIGTVALMVGITVATSRDRDLQPRPLRWHEYLTMAASGVVVAMFYDLAYLTPLVALAFGAARCVASRTSLRAALATAAAKRWLAHAVGFAAVFVPVRIAIAVQCAGGACYNGADLSLSVDALRTALPRLLTGFPPVGWHFNADLARSAAVELTFTDLGANALIAVLVAAIAVAAVSAAHRQPGPIRPALAMQDSESHSPELHAAELPAGSPARLAAVLAVLAAWIAVLSAATAGLTAWAQQRQPPIGQAWRETLLTQMAWSLAIAACLALLDAAAKNHRAHQLLRVAVAAALAVAMSLTLLANWRFAEASRRSPDAVLTSLVSLSAVNMDNTPAGNAVRCALIDAYTETTAGQPSWTAGEAIGENLNDLTLERRGFAFCDPTQLP